MTPAGPDPPDLISQAQAYEKDARDTADPPPFNRAAFTRQDGLDAHDALERLRAITRFWRMLRRWAGKLIGSATIALIITGAPPWMIELWHRMEAGWRAFWRTNQ